MEEYKKAFIEQLLRTGALKFGEFTLKSGRVSPHFINMGGFADGESISKLSYYYASKIMDTVKPETFDLIFGPAYKGIQLAAGTCYSLYVDFKQNKSFAFDRKEIKDYGFNRETDDRAAKLLVGAPIKPGCRIIIIDDVFTSGDTKVEAVELLKTFEPTVEFRSVLFAVDRLEVGPEGESAVESFTKKTGIGCESIINIAEILDYLSGTGKLAQQHLENAVRYLGKYGTESVKAALTRF